MSKDELNEARRNAERWQRRSDTALRMAAECRRQLDELGARLGRQRNTITLLLAENRDLRDENALLRARNNVEVPEAHEGATNTSEVDSEALAGHRVLIESLISGMAHLVADVEKLKNNPAPVEIKVVGNLTTKDIRDAVEKALSSRDKRNEYRKRR